MAATQIGMAREAASLASDGTVLTTLPRQQNFLAATGKTFDYRLKLCAYNADGTTVDTSVTANATATVTVGTCTLGGTVTRAAVSGVWDFSDLYPATGTGSLAITIASAGLTSFVTDTMTVVTPQYDAYALAQHSVQAELPRYEIDTTMPTVFARTITVGPAQSIVTGVSYQTVQAAIDYCTTASGGANDITGNTKIVCDIATYAETVVWRARSAGKGWIIITPASPATAEGTRAQLANAASMPQLSIENPQGIVQTVKGAHHYRLVGFDIAVPKPALGTATEIFAAVDLHDAADSFTSLTEMPHHLGIDRCLVRSLDIANTRLRKGVYFDPVYSFIVESRIEGAHDYPNGVNNGNGNGDTNAIGIAYGTGPALIRNNYLASAGEVLICGGANPFFYDVSCRDVTVTRNVWDKPASYLSAGYPAKNNFELKNARRWRIEGNVHQGSWKSGQDGTGILFASLNQRSSQGLPNAAAKNFQGITDLTYRNNVSRNMASWITLLGENYSDAVLMTRVSVHDNVAWNINEASALSDVGRLALFGNGLSQTVFEHNTALASVGRTTKLMQVGFPTTMPNATTYVRNNIATCESYGVIGDGVGPGTATINPGFPDDTAWEKNVLIAPSGSDAFGGSGFPPASYYPASLAAVGFTDATITSSWDTADPDTVCAALTLSGSSTYKGVATDASDPGADMTAVRSAIAGVWDGTASSTADHLALSVQPSGAVSGQALTTQPVVLIQNASNATVTSDTSTVTAAWTTLTGDATLSGTTTAVAVAGIATFATLALSWSVDSTGYFTFTDGSLTSTTSSTLTLDVIEPVPPSRTYPTLTVSDSQSTVRAKWRRRLSQWRQLAGLILL